MLYKLITLDKPLSMHRTSIADHIFNLDSYKDDDLLNDSSSTINEGSQLIKEDLATDIVNVKRKAGFYRVFQKKHNPLSFEFL